jgi:uncharacterized repeat protein (TIGR01451 family)
MKKTMYVAARKRHNGAWTLAMFAALMFASLSVAQAQTPGGTTVTNTVMGISKYKSYAADTSRALISFTVGAVPNFSIHTLASWTTLTNRDTVRLWISYQNIGNTPADVVVRNFTDKNYLQYTSVPASASMSGDTMVWHIANVLAGQKDSVQFLARVTDTASGGLVISSYASLQWLKGTTSAVQQFNVVALPALALTIVPSLDRIGSGRNIDYVLTLTNNGTGATDGARIVDSLSATGTYLAASIAPDSVSVNKRVIIWNIGAISGGQARSVTLTVHSQVNLQKDSVVSAATASAANAAETPHAFATTPIVPLNPALVVMTATERFIFGGLAQGAPPVDSTLVTVDVKDSLGRAIPDGVPVSLTTDHGSFAGGVQAMQRTTLNGQITFYLRSEYVSSTFIVATLYAVAGTTGTAQCTTTVTMFPAAVTGLVRDGQTMQPIEGAVAEVRNTVDTLLGRDVTKADGIFFIPLQKKLENYPYTLTIFVRDKFGDTVQTKSTIDPTLFPRPAFTVLNTIAGRLQYANRDKFIPIPGVAIHLDSITRTLATGARQFKREIGKLFRVRSVATDDAGRFRFDSLRTAIYQLAVDSTRFPGYAGEISLTDTTNGTFTINMNIDVQADSALSIAMNGPAKAYAGDTLRYVLHYANIGNMVHSNLQMWNTLPPFTVLDSAQRGGFTSVAFDTAARSVRWTMNSLPLNAADSVWMRLIVAKNIPENTQLNDTTWMSSDKITGLQSNVVSTVLRTSPNLFIYNFQVLGTGRKDSVLSGDSLHFMIVYGNNGTGIVRGVVITDSLLGFSHSLVTLQHSTMHANKDKDTVLSENSRFAAWRVDSLAAVMSDTVNIWVKTDPGVTAKKLLQTHAYFYRNDTLRCDSSSNVTVTANSLFASYLELNKMGNKKTVEIGDIVTYQVTVKNNSAFVMTGLDVTDRLPYSFKYYKSSARWNGRPLEPQLPSHATSMRWVRLDTLPAGQMITITYQVVVGADALESDGINTVYASASLPPGVPVFAQPKQWQVTVRAGVFTERGLIIGKVFYDDDRNLYQSNGEDGVKGVDLWMEDGTRITTGDDGKYSLPDVKPGQHVLRVDERTLPPGTKLLPGLTRFAGDPASQFVRLTESGIARANFYLQRVMRDSLAQSVAKGTKYTLQRLTSPQFLYLHENFRPGSPHNTLTISVRFTYSGSTYLQKILLHDSIPEEMSYLNGSAEFNGRKIEPKAEGRELLWNLGRTGAIGEGLLTYKVTARPAQAEEMTVQLQSVLELMTADSLFMMSEPLVTKVVMRSVVFTEKTISLSGRIFETGKSFVVENGPKKFNEIVGRVQSLPFAEFVVVTYPDAARIISSTDTSGMALAAARASELDQFLARRVGEDSVRVSVRSIFDYTSAGSSMQPIAGDVALRQQDYFYNGLVPRDTGYALTAPLTGKADASEKAFGDTVRIQPGDMVTVHGTYIYDPAMKHSMIILIDSLQRTIVVDDGSFTVNGVKVPVGSFSLRAVSPALSLNRKPKMRDADYTQIISIDVTKFVKAGPNEIAFSGRVSDADDDSIIVNKMSVRSWNVYKDETVVHANKTVFLVDRTPRSPKTVLEPPKPKIRTVVPVAFEEDVAKMESLKEKVGKAIVMDGVTFLQGSSTLTESAKSLLGQVVMTLKENPTIELEIGGHTDNVGSAVTNRKLSLARAESVKTFLKSLGIAPARLTTKGYGPDKPLESNKTAAGKAKNRRVEFTRTK